MNEDGWGEMEESGERGERGVTGREGGEAKFFGEKRKENWKREMRCKIRLFSRRNVTDYFNISKVKCVARADPSTFSRLFDMRILRM